MTGTPIDPRASAIRQAADLVTLAIKRRTLLTDLQGIDAQQATLSIEFCQQMYQLEKTIRGAV